MTDDDEYPAGRFDADVRRAMRVATTLAHKGSQLTLRVALVALVVVGLAFLTGLAALGGGAQAIWVIVGGVLLATAVGAPLLASFHLASIPRNEETLTDELRTLLSADPEARRVVVETFAVDDDAVLDADADREVDGEVGGDADEPPPPRAGARVPAVIMQGQQYTRVYTIADRVGGHDAITRAFRRLATLPSLIFIGIALTALGGFVGFILLLVWIF